MGTLTGSDLKRLQRNFPAVTKKNLRATSAATFSYNCIAWAVGDSSRCWWPFPPYYWPDGLPRNTTVAAFVSLFESHGYMRCDSPALVQGIQKVAIFALGGAVTHAARQLQQTGEWTSKLGKQIDVAHSLQALEGPTYGAVVEIMERASRGEDIAYYLAMPD